MSKCMSDVSLKYRWASRPGGGSLPSGAELCCCLRMEDGGWKEGGSIRVETLHLVQCEATPLAESRHALTRGRALRG